MRNKLKRRAWEIAQAGNARSFNGVYDFVIDVCSICKGGADPRSSEMYVIGTNLDKLLPSSRAYKNRKMEKV